MNKYKESGRVRDKAMSKARRDSDWEKQFSYALFEEDARAIRHTRQPHNNRTCTMCGEFCANEGSSRLFKDDLVPGEKR
jgi:phosphomethylpyrimidine synthase